jgi:hypothetical protein
MTKMQQSNATPAAGAAIPEGYRMDAQGRLVPEAMIKPIDLLRDQLVQGIVKDAKDLSQKITEIRARFFSDIAAFVATSAEGYNVRLGGTKGNVTLVSYDGRFKVVRAIQETLTFDERLQVAKALIDSCLTRWSEGSRPEIKVLINDAFQVDKAGNINTARVLALRRLEIDDDEWRRAMRAIDDALSVVGSKSYVRIYERVGESDRYMPISLDMSA